jgi:hypothetical protein
VTEHDVFRTIRPESILPLVRTANLICGRPGVDVQRWRDAGFAVYVLGARASSPQIVRAI